MRLLLDTHTFLWLANGDPANELFLSMATAWEMAIKTGLKKLALSAPYATFMTKAITGYGLALVPITVDDCAGYEALPFPDPNHRDPFDRMIIVQAMTHNLSILGVDAAFESCPMTRVW